MKSISLILLGCGGVGRQLLEHIISCRPVHAKQGVRLRVVGVSDSKSLLISPDVFTNELDDGILYEICRVKQSGSPLSALESAGAYPVFSDSQITSKIMDIAGHLGRSTGLALVDCSASAETVAILKTVTDNGCCIVLANKRPLSLSLKDYDKLMCHPRRIRHESTVGAGLPIIVTINRFLSTGDTIHRIVGSLSGTLGYVMSEVEDGKPFSQVVKTARNLGYTEPDPRDDLSGMDVARKALILARLLGQRINLDDVKVESLYPENMGPKAMSVEEFVSNGLPQLDREIEERVARASSDGKALRYVCVIEGSRCEVGLQELPKSSAQGRLRGSDNVVEVYSRCYREQPLVIQGAGAGNDTTAAGVLADILDMQDLFA